MPVPASDAGASLQLASYQQGGQRDHMHQRLRMHDAARPASVLRATNPFARIRHMWPVPFNTGAGMAKQERHSRARA